MERSCESSFHIKRPVTNASRPFEAASCSREQSDQQGLKQKRKELMKRIEILGILSGICTTSAFIPQVYTVWNMKPTPATAVSLPMYVIFTTGVIGWTIYGIKVRSLSIAAFNTLTSLLAISIIVYKCLYG
jgi:MtN3 and saliva related transmembrane protein